ncbi:type VI secretion system-associated protein [Serratia ureilytica]
MDAGARRPDGGADRAGDELSPGLLPSQKLEVFIDDVKNSNPASWCGKSIPLRIVSAQSQDPAVLNDFCRASAICWKSSARKPATCPDDLDKRGGELASGEAASARGWKPVVKQEAVESAGNPAAAGDPRWRCRDLPACGHRAGSAFQPAGCHFRTFRRDEANGGAVHSRRATLRCGETAGCRRGAVTTGRPSLSLTLWFLQGHSLAQINGGDRALTVVSANAQRLVLRQPAGAGSFLLLSWNRSCTRGRSTASLKCRASTPQTRTRSNRAAAGANRPQPLLSAPPADLLLVEKLAADRVDPPAAAPVG